MSDLKPCDHCGEDDGVVIWKHERGFIVECGECGASSGVYPTKEKAAKAWNTRPAEDAKDREIERLKEALNEIRTIGDCTEMIEDVVARGMMRKIAFDALYGKTIIKLLGKDTDVPANAPDTNVGKMEEK